MTSHVFELNKPPNRSVRATTYNFNFMHVIVALMMIFGLENLTTLKGLPASPISHSHATPRCMRYLSCCIQVEESCVTLAAAGCFFVGQAGMLDVALSLLTSPPGLSAFCCRMGCMAQPLPIHNLHKREDCDQLHYFD